MNQERSIGLSFRDGWAGGQHCLDRSKWLSILFLDMRHLLLLPFLVASSMAVMPVHAGLGSATSKTQSSAYDAWCGEKGNDCKVSFSNGKITVNDSDSVDFEYITYITRNAERDQWTGDFLYTFGIEYLEKGMDDPEFAEILFQHSKTANKFWRDLRRACRNCKDRDGIQVDVNIKE